MANECSKLNLDCMMKNNIQCPAYDADKNCWEYDWLPAGCLIYKFDRQKGLCYLLY
jgi:hypothetical protein